MKFKSEINRVFFYDLFLFYDFIKQNRADSAKMFSRCQDIPVNSLYVYCRCVRNQQSSNVDHLMQIVSCINISCYDIYIYFLLLFFYGLQHQHH